MIDQYARVSLGLRHLSQTSLERLYKHLDVPSRGEVDALAASLRRVEDKLDQLLPAATSTQIAPRPPRTRRPRAEPLPAPRKAASKREKKEGNEDASAE
ncbi:hypothetical protein D3C85_1515860 [compost metagenome]